MPEKEFKLDQDCELRFEVESKKETVDLKAKYFVVTHRLI